MLRRLATTAASSPGCAPALLATTWYIVRPAWACDADFCEYNASRRASGYVLMS
ncbi:hypothetical protein COCC4DRAFT_31792, partial [Bipolaris maydis ATCC 48331]